MKKFLTLFLAVLIFSQLSCEKEKQVPSGGINKQVSSDEPKDQISDPTINSEGKFMKEIAITDESGMNSVFFAVYSDDENLLRSFIEANEFSLMINEDDIEKIKSTEISDLKEADSLRNDGFSLDQDPKIIIDLITDNLQEDVKSYSLNIKQKDSRANKDFIIGFPIGYTTSNDFIGAVHLGWGYEFIAQITYKSNWWNSWKKLTINGANAWFIYPYGSYYIWYSYPSSYRLGLIIYPHYFQTTTNYRIAYSRNELRGHNCTIGSYDGANCYVGTPPSGTTAFMYPNNSGNFYYTPVNGNQCPYPGSYYDGANCYVLDIPSSCSGFIYHNSWYVKPDIIY